MSRIFGKDERGLVSFLITLIMMLVITLIVVGFTQVTNRNKREVLDRQLSAQAFYAAESGVNDAVAQINTTLGTGGTVTQQTDCDPATNPYMVNSSLSSDGSVKYTCVLVNPIAPDIRVGATTNSSSVVHIEPVNSNGTPLNIAQLNFTWYPKNGAGSPPETGCTTGGIFPVNASYTCGYPILRVDLMHVTAGQTSAQALANNTESFYFRPVNGAGSSLGLSNFDASGGSPDPRANIVEAGCSAATHTCRGTLLVNGLGGPASNKEFYARISTIYSDTPQVIVDAGPGVSAATATNGYFKDQEIVVDVTGKAQDVLRRIQVRVPLGEYGAPVGIGSASDVCKRFTIFDNGVDEPYYDSEC